MKNILVVIITVLLLMTPVSAIAEEHKRSEENNYVQKQCMKDWNNLLLKYPEQTKQFQACIQNNEEDVFLKCIEKSSPEIGKIFKKCFGDISREFMKVAHRVMSSGVSNTFSRPTNRELENLRRGQKVEIRLIKKNNEMKKVWLNVLKVITVDRKEPILVEFETEEKGMMINNKEHLWKKGDVIWLKRSQISAISNF